MRVLLSLTLVLLGGCACLCDIDGAVRARGGPGATDCGHVHVNEDPTTAFDCVDSAIATSHGFYVRWDQLGRDTEQRGYMAGHDGSFSFFHYGGPLGSGCPELDEAPCTGPITRSAGGRDLTCPSTMSHVVCSN